MKTFLSCLIGLFVLGCTSFPNSSSVKKSKTDLEKENLKGDVILVESDDVLTFYNDQGNKSKGFFQKEDYSLTTLDYIDGKITTKTDNNLFTGYKDDITTYSYNEKGELVSSISNEIVQNYLYENGYLKTEKLYVKNNKNRGSELTYYYNQNGEIDSTVMIVNWDDTKTIDISIFNRNGEVASNTYFNILDSGIRKMMSYSLYTYDDKGNITSALVNSIDENTGQTTVKKTTYEYSFDPKGNWIQQRSFVDGKEEEVVNRKIFYKGQDISKYENKYNDFIVSIKSIGNNENNGGINKSSSNNNESTQQQKKLVNCGFCGGQGINKCGGCNGRGYNSCSKCFGKGWEWYNSEKRTCYDCNGTGEKKCRDCSGRGNRGLCAECNGKGKVLR